MRFDPCKRVVALEGPDSGARPLLSPSTEMLNPQPLGCLPPAEINLVESVPASATREAGPLTTGTVKDDWRELPIPTGRPTSIRISAK